MVGPLIILCPGQGAQAIGMGRRWAETSPAAAAVFDEADRVLGSRFDRPLSRICFEGPETILNRTDVAQPAIYTASVACFRALFGDLPKESIVASAGLSLGEYTALHLAGCFSFSQGLELVALRGREMQEAAEAVPSGMVALIGAEPEQAQAVCEQAASGQVLVPANFNAPGQIVLSGESAACDRAVAAAGAMGLRATRLVVAGAFHSPLMARAAERLGAALERLPLTPPAFPVVSNVTARPHEPGQSASTAPNSLRQRLVDQLTRPVRWSESCQWLSATITGQWHELAPGKVLAGLMRRINRDLKVTSHDEPA